MPGQDYYTIVNNKGEELEEMDPITGYKEIMKFSSEEEALDTLSYFIEEEWLKSEDGWHVERERW